MHERSTITLSSDAVRAGNVATIIDFTGRVVRQLSINTESTTIERGNLSSGTYSLLIHNKEGQNVNFKFVIE